MKTCNLFKPEIGDHTFGSSFDPVLNGVAQGLASLFPPVETVRPTEPDEAEAWRNEADPDDE